MKMKLKDMLFEGKNKHGVPIMTKKADVKKLIKQLDKAEKELDKVYELLGALPRPALMLAREELKSWNRANERGEVSDSDVEHSNYKTKAEQLLHNFIDSLNGGLSYKLIQTQKAIQPTRTFLNKLLDIL